MVAKASQLPAVSVVIPTYNHRDYVSETLVSVFGQAFTDYEVIVVNDGSPDDTGAVVQPFVEAGQIRYIEQSNRGQAAARNRGIAEARGQFIALLDDDDLWPTDKLAWQVAELVRSPETVAVAGTCLFGIPAQWPDFPAAPPVREFARPADFAGGAVFYSPGQMLIRRDAIARVGGFDPDLSGVDDWDLYLRLAAEGPIRFVDRCALGYRLHATNASRNVGRMRRQASRLFNKHRSTVFASAPARAAYRKHIRTYHGAAYVSRAVHRRKNGDYLGGAADYVRAIWTDPTLVKVPLAGLLRRLGSNANEVRPIAPTVECPSEVTAGGR